MHSTFDPCLFALEDRGYSRGMGHCVLPSGQLLACSHEDPNLDLNNLLLQLTFVEHTKGIA